MKFSIIPELKPKKITAIDAGEIFAVWSNSDLTEGRGQEYCYALCKSETTANRMGKGRYVMGTDCRVTEEKLYIIDNRLYAPAGFSFPPTEGDVLRDKELEAKRRKEEARKAAIEKAKTLGLNDEDIAALQ